MSERRCILSGERADPSRLVRLAISPDGDVLPDVRGKAPGRGAWLGVSRAELEAAMAKGRLRGVLGRAFYGEALRVPDDLPARIDAALQKALLDRLGLEARASGLISGFDKIDVAARRGQVRLLLHAVDAGADGCRKLNQAWRVGEDEEGTDKAGIVLPVDRDALSMALGRANVVHVAVTNTGAARRIGDLLDRWQSYLGCANAAPGDVSGDVGNEEAGPRAASDQASAMATRVAAGAGDDDEGLDCVDE